MDKSLSIKEIYPYLIQNFPSVEWGIHLHSTPQQSLEKIEAAFTSGCTRFDSALKGFGGCPMAADNLTGNIATENVIDYLKNAQIELSINNSAFAHALDISNEVFIS